MSKETIVDKHFVSTECKEFSDDELSFVAYASKEVIDRDGEMIKSNAWDLEDFRKNPVVVLAHDYSQLPVGKSLWEKVGPDGLKFKPKFANTATGREVYQLYKEGILNAFSVGFIPEEWEDGKGTKARRVYTKAKLLEISCVAVPSCPDALVERVAKGLVTDKKLKQAFEDIIPHDRFADVEEKAASPSGQPSMFDIMGAIVKALSTSPDGERHLYIEDIYPSTATTGMVIVEFVGVEEPMRSNCWQYTYQYDKATNVATLTAPMPVEEVYVPKGLKRFGNVEEKAGRELSAKNLTVLKNIAEKLADASDEIGAMLDGKAPVADEEKAPEEVETKEVQDELSIEDIKEVMAVGMTELATQVKQSAIDKDDIRGIIMDEIKRAKGRVD